MTQTENRILMFESRLMQDKRELNELIYQYYQYQAQSGQSELMRAKLDSLKREIDEMSAQLELLRASVPTQVNMGQYAMQMSAGQPQQTMQPNAGQPQSNAMPQQVNMAQSQSPQQNYMGQPQPMMQPNVGQQSMDMAQSQPSQQNYMGQPSAQMGTMPQTAQRSKEVDLERAFGKSWMGIIASGLIFVSLIIFAILLVPHLTDGIKMAAMFLVSFAFAAVGFYKLGKDHNNKFYIALSGCGTGAIYISLLLSHLYFHAIGEIALYALILVWAVCVCVVSRMESVVFQWIGQIGILVAVSFGCWLCTDRQDEAMLLMLAIFFVLTSLVFALAHRKKELTGNLVNLGFDLANLLLFWMFCSGSGDSKTMTFLSMTLGGYAVLHIVFFFTCELSEAGAEFGVLGSMYFLAAVFLRGLSPIANEDVYEILELAFCVALLCVLEIRLRKKAWIGKLVFQIVIMLVMMFDISMADLLRDTVSYAVLMLPFLVAGFLLDNWVFKYGSLLYLWVYLVLGYAVNESEIRFGFSAYGLVKIVLILLYYVTLTVFSVRKKEQYQSAFKLVAYGLFLWALAYDCGYIVSRYTSFWEDGFELSATAWCILGGGLNLVLSKRLNMDRNPLTGKPETESKVVLYLVQGIAMSLSLYLIAWAPNEAVHFLMIAWTLVLFLANTKNVLDHFSGMFAGFYVGIKLSVLLAVIVGSFDTLGVPLSIGFLLLAIVSIAVGFRFEYKSLRIYGLVLSMVSVLKLIMADMSYDNLTELAAAFFVSGILCFVISMIYNRIDRKYKENVQDR